jgi:hypothetical protein
MALLMSASDAGMITTPSCSRMAIGVLLALTCSCLPQWYIRIEATGVAVADEEAAPCTFV